MNEQQANKIRRTPQNRIVTINPGDQGGKRQVAFSEAQKLIHRCITATNYAQAAAISVQLADQLPQDPWPHLVAAESLYLHQQIEPAFHYINRTLEIDPRNIAGFVIKARICLYSGRHADAREMINAAIRLAPNNAQLLFEQGELLSEAGDLAGARKALLKSIELDPGKIGSLLSLSRLPGDNFSGEMIGKVESIIQSRQLPADDQVSAHFALANAYDKKNRMDRHFAHLNAGNSIKNRSLQYNADASRQETEDITGFFSEDFFSRRADICGNPARIIFIVGFPRCGSTLVEHILSSHPSVDSAGEIFALNHAVRYQQQSKGFPARYPHWIGDQPDSTLLEIAENYLHRVEQFNRNTCLTDKLLNNYIHIGLIHLIFPNAKIINVQRNPVGVCYSCYKNLFYLSSVPYSYNLHNLADKYRQYRRLIRHWDQVLPGKIHTIEYEQLVDRQEDVTRDLLEHCGLEWDDACLDFQKNTRTVLTNSSIQVRQPLYQTSVDRWKLCKEYLGPLLELTNG